MGAQALKAVGVFLFDDMRYKITDNDGGSIEMFINSLGEITFEVSIDNQYPYFIAFDRKEQVEDMIEALTILKEKANLEP